MKNRTHSTLFVVLTALSVVSMLVSNIGAFKQNAFLQWSVPGGTVVFVVTYILSDVFSEVYGYRASRFTCWLSFALNIFAVFMLQIAIWLPAPEWFQYSAEFELVLGQAPRTLIAGMAAYVLGDWLNDYVFQKMREKDGQKRFAFRAILSSFCGEAVDSTVFTLIAFLGVLPTKELPGTIITLVILKTAYEAVILPITVLVVKYVRKYEQKHLEAINAN